ncbi:MAG: DUF1858 domain-containing protein [Planctomycetes bacterium]|nr:DUF1858 domain-containing protein [Planctomycetota bacterium]
MLIADIVDAHPKCQEVLESYRLPCHRCVVAWSETLEMGLLPHGIDPDVVIARLDAEAPPKKTPRRHPK